MFIPTVLLLALQASCDADCLDLWFRNQFDGLRHLPGEVIAETLLKAASTEQDRHKRERILAGFDEILPAVMEEFPVAPVVLRTDSVPGEASRASSEQFNRVSLQMRRIELMARTDLTTAISQWQQSQMPQVTPKHKERGETVDYLIYYRIGMQLYDQLLAEGKTAEANLHLLQVLNTIDTQSALADFHQILALRMQTGKLTPGFLALYRVRLGALLPKDQPQMGNWVRIVFFWKLLLTGEAKETQPELLQAIESYLRHSSEAPPSELRFAVSTAKGTKYWGDYWPDEAKAQFEKMMANVSWAEGTTQRVAGLGELFYGRAKRLEDRPMIAFWARPHAEAMFSRYANLLRERRALTEQGAWEPRLGQLLEDLKNYGAKDPTAEDILLDFLEKARIYQGLLGLSGVDGTIAVKAENAAALAKQLKERPPHSAKQGIILALLDLLESEAGQKVYQRRRLLWLGVLAKLRDEAYLVKGEVLEAFRKRALASGNDIIRHFAAE
jgi:hypothetical protein